MLKMLRKSLLKIATIGSIIFVMYLFYYNSYQIQSFGDNNQIGELDSVQSTVASIPAAVNMELPPSLPASNITAKPACQRQNSFVFIKTHKSGSTTLIAPFQKYAYLHHLSMMVPAFDNNIHLSWPYKFTPRVSHMLAPDGKPFQALVNHIVYNKKTVQPLMEPSAKYLTVLREPAPHLVSAYQYFSVTFENVSLRKGLADFELFLSDPVKYDPMPVWMSNLKNTQLRSLTRNLQSADLGLHYSSFDNTTAVKEFIEEIRHDFSILLILERLSESLVLMKRQFCWSMQDIIHVNKNIQKTAWNWNIRNISQHLTPKIYEWNNADTILYSMANEKLNQLRQNQEGLEEEIRVYNDINIKVSRYCAGNVKKWKEAIPPPPPLVINKTPYNEQFIVDNKFCVLLVIPEDDFTLLHKCRQYPHYKQCEQNHIKISELTSIIGG